jgi:hypothetical protein
VRIGERGELLVGLRLKLLVGQGDERVGRDPRGQEALGDRLGLARVDAAPVWGRPAGAGNRRLDLPGSP